jgi:hypothetical protein
VGENNQPSHQSGDGSASIRGRRLSYRQLSRGLIRHAILRLQNRDFAAYCPAHVALLLPNLNLNQLVLECCWAQRCTRESLQSQRDIIEAAT